MVKIAASILNSDILNLGSELDRLASVVDRIHFDVMDGHFVDNLSFGLPVLKQVREKTILPIDVHLMISNPEYYIEDYATYADSIYVHFEATGMHTQHLLRRITDARVIAGLVINPNTNPEDIAHLLPSLSHLLVMSVWPGFGGQACIPACLEKISKIKKIAPHTTVTVDGGINNITAPIAIDHGADILVSGSYLMKSTDINTAVKSLRTPA